MYSFDKGSQWNKWDLQVHTPFSYLNNQFGTDWDNYVKRLLTKAIAHNIAAIGITDYFCIEGYKKLKNEYLNNDAKLHELFTDEEIIKIKDILILPNVEFRLSNFVEQRLNFHVIFSDEVSISDIEENFLHELDFVEQGHIQSEDENRKLKIANLEALGERLKGEHENFAATPAIQVGMTNAVVDHGQIVKILANKKSLFEKKYLVGIPADEDLSQVSWDSQGHLTRKILYQKSDFFFSSNPNTRDFCLGLKHATIEEYLSEFHTKKPCIWSCDAHTYDDMFCPDQNRYTWIKADPTFEGLKQITYEPEERVKIQDHNPYEDRSKVYFNGIKLSGSTNFILTDFKLPLNRELVAIIGGRGSGKSALLDTFAFLNEEHLKADRNNKKKIIEYYRDNEGRKEPPPLFTLETTLVDKDSAEHNFSKSLTERTNLELPFLYLGQEQLSGIATNDFELTRTVCQLIGIDVNEVGQESLISRARENLSGIENTEKLITNIFQRYIALGYPQTIRLETWIADYLTKLREQQTRLSSKETRAILEDINKKTQQGLKFKELSEKAGVLLEQLKNIPINQDIKNFNAQLSKLYATFPAIATLEVTNQLQALTEIQRKTKADMDDLRNQIISQKQTLIKQGIKEDVNSLLQASENLQKQISGIEADVQSYKEAEEKLSILSGEKDSILGEIKKLLEMVRDAITNAFVEFQGSRADSSQEEKGLFEKIIGGIGVEGQIIFDEKVFTKKVLSNFIDNRKISNETELKKLIAGENADGTAKEITFDSLKTWTQSDLSSEKCFNRAGLKGLIEFIFTEWPTFLRVKAIAKLNGKPTEVLSIGQRGTLLLKVYLATSTAKQVFIIDQPEDNLDNSFIMTELVPLVRRAKRSRQIIMSTHNANLVVNADAEQIVVALLDQDSANPYFSGSLENPTINKAVKDILEGGEQAFRQREKKYQII
ncbi:MAG: AAA family ATPase [Candidatus Doudnabacteria bacterium]|jgi:ABC-type lipoprotein export system ATPase subunit